MDNFIKITTGWVRQYYEPNKDGVFVCTGQEFKAGDLSEYEDDGGNPANPPEYKYQPYDMVQPGLQIPITKELLAAINAGSSKVKKIEAKSVPVEFRKNSAWLDAIYDVINRTALAIRDEIECMPKQE